MRIRKVLVAAGLIALNVGLGLSLFSARAEANPSSDKYCQWTTCGPNQGLCQQCLGAESSCGTDACGVAT